MLVRPPEINLFFNQNNFIRLQPAWVHRYESCGEFINKMEPSDDLSFLKHALFSSKVLDLVSFHTYQCNYGVKLFPCI